MSSNNNIDNSSLNEAASLKRSIAYLNANLKELIDLLKDKKVRDREQGY